MRHTPSPLSQLNIALVGAASRGGSFTAAFAAHPRTRIHAVCDVREDLLDEAKAKTGAGEAFTDYDEMLEKSDIDAVVIGTPMQFHAPQAILALQRNIHVLSEVTAGVSVEECRALVAAAARSRGVYMMAENYAYMKPNVLVKALAQRGLFGDLYYAEGEYIHELKALNEQTPWRRKWQTGIDGITYPTHSLGPILQWMAGDRVVRVCCEGSGHHYRDPRGEFYENQDSCVMLAKTARGALIKIRVDMLSNRPHAMTNYQLQGTKGCYESARSSQWQERNRVWLAELSLGSEHLARPGEPGSGVSAGDVAASAEGGVGRGPRRRRLLRDHGFRRQHRRRRAVSHRHPRGDGHDAAWADQPGVDPGRRRVAGRARFTGVG